MTPRRSHTSANGTTWYFVNRKTALRRPRVTLASWPDLTDNEKAAVMADRLAGRQPSVMDAITDVVKQVCAPQLVQSLLASTDVFRALEKSVVADARYAPSSAVMPYSVAIMVRGLPMRQASSAPPNTIIAVKTDGTQQTIVL